jgi:hypothetical protein
MSAVAIGRASARGIGRPDPGVDRRERCNATALPLPN